MEFAIDKEPLSLNEINNQIKAIKQKLLISLTVGEIIVLLFSFKYSVFENIILYFMIYLIFWFFLVCINYTPNGVFVLDGLSQIPIQYCEHALELCIKYTELNEYRLRVLELDRPLTYGEYMMMKQWDSEYDERVLEEKQKERQHMAFKKLTGVKI